MLVLAVLLLQSSVDDAAMARYRAKTAASIRCTQATNKEEVTVCASRTTEKFRVPLIEDKAVAIRAERERLLAKPSNCNEKSAFLVGCGMAGGTASVAVGAAGSQAAKIRPGPP